MAREAIESALATDTGLRTAVASGSRPWLSAPLSAVAELESFPEDDGNLSLLATTSIPGDVLVFSINRVHCGNEFQT